MPRGGASIHQLKETLTRVRPSVWRRNQVASTINLRRLNDIIQATMGWTYPVCADRGCGRYRPPVT